MELGDILSPEGVIPSLKAKSKKLALQELAQKASQQTGLASRDLFDAMLQRERLGSTGMGRGVAIPHVKFRNLERLHCLFARLDEAIDYEALDNEPVDIIFLLIAPEHASGDHLKALARISRLIREPRALERLRASKDRTALFAILTEPTAHAA
jgi:PTS system nitrogen regulatory IIA component